jgi:hypothetical protein
MLKAFTFWPYLKRASIIFSVCLCFVCTGYAAERDITLRWDKSIDDPSLQSYVVYYYTKQGAVGSLTASDYAVSYTLSGGSPILINPRTDPKPITIDKSNTQITLHFSSDSKTYYFAVTAVDTRGREGLPSNEVSTIALYFPHVATDFPWQTEIAIVNASDQSVIGTLKAFSNSGQLVTTKRVILFAHGRKQIVVAYEFTNHANIGYIVFDTNSASVQGYTKLSIEGSYRAAIPAVKEVNKSDIYITHVASDAQWWTGLSLVNTTSAAKVLTITFNDGRIRQITLNANEHRAFDIASLFNSQPQPDIQSGVIANASGIIGLELFGSINQLDGILLTDKTASTLYYPHVDSNGWWTGIVAYNPSESDCTITITPYTSQGISLGTLTPPPIAGKGKYIGVASDIGLPPQTAWFKIDSTRPLSGFELFGTADESQLAPYAGGGGTGAKTGVFAKIEKLGWTGIAFVNTEASVAYISLLAYDDYGNALAARELTVLGHAKVVKPAEAIFLEDISGATYIAYVSTRNVVGFQLNGSADWTMLDGLPGM